MSGRLTMTGGLMELGMLATGCIITIMTKAAFSSSSKGWGGHEHLYEHPWTQSLFMFIAEALCMVAFLITKFVPTRGKAYGPLEGSSRPTRLLDLFPPLLAIPMCLDLMGTSICSIGLLYVSASVWQMLRGSMIVFSCILTTVFLKRKTPAWRWVAVSITVCGLALVGLSGVLSTAHVAQMSGSSEEEVAESSWKTLVGIVLVLVAMLITGTQMVVEEVLVKNKGYVPLQVVGMEGFLGTLAMTLVVLPIFYVIPGSIPSSMKRGSYENVLDAFIQIGNNGSVLCLVLGYIVFDSLFNYFGVSVTRCLSAVHRTMVDTCRGVVVWGWQLMTYYCISERFGEQWTKYSGLQVAGFVLLIAGTVLYNGIVRLPYFAYEDEPGAASEDKHALIAPESGEAPEEPLCDVELEEKRAEGTAKAAVAAVQGP
eukprot:m51a1_g8442 hypothetical protein (426) ;mRNA; r:375425-377099